MLSALSGRKYLYFFCKDARCWLHGILFFSSKLTRIKPFGKVSWPSSEIRIVVKYWWLVLMSEANWRADPTEISMTKFIPKEEKELSVMFVWLRDLLNRLCTAPRENAVKTWRRRKKNRSHESQARALLIIACLSPLLILPTPFVILSSSHPTAAFPQPQILLCRCLPQLSQNNKTKQTNTKPN